MAYDYNIKKDLHANIFLGGKFIGEVKFVDGFLKVEELDLNERLGGIGNLKSEDKVTIDSNKILIKKHEEYLLYLINKDGYIDNVIHYDDGLDLEYHRDKFDCISKGYNFVFAVETLEKVFYFPIDRMIDSMLDYVYLMD